MNRNSRPRRLSLLVVIITLALAGVLWWSQPTQATSPHLGYGANVAEWDISLLNSMGFNWIKVFNAPGSDLPQNVLIRVDANYTHLGDVTAFGNSVQALAQNNGAYIDAYEIGNEVNLDASYGMAGGHLPSPLITKFSCVKPIPASNRPTQRPLSFRRGWLLPDGCRVTGTVTPGTMGFIRMSGNICERCSMWEPDLVLMPWATIRMATARISMPHLMLVPVIPPRIVPMVFVSGAWRKFTRLWTRSIVWGTNKSGPRSLAGLSSRPATA